MSNDPNDPNNIPVMTQHVAPPQHTGVSSIGTSGAPEFSNTDAEQLLDNLSQTEDQQNTIRLSEFNRYLPLGAKTIADSGLSLNEHAVLSSEYAARFSQYAPIRITDDNTGNVVHTIPAVFTPLAPTTDHNNTVDTFVRYNEERLKVHSVPATNNLLAQVITTQKKFQEKHNLWEDGKKENTKDLVTKTLKEAIATGQKVTITAKEQVKKLTPDNQVVVVVQDRVIEIDPKELLKEQKPKAAEAIEPEDLNFDGDE